MALISTKVYENNLRTLFALEGYLSFKQNWKLSKGRNVGIFDDLVFESDSRIILLQIKHSGHKELSDDNENEIHFYKYVLSSMINSHNDKTLFVLCTNRIISKELFEKGDDEMLYNILGDGKSMRYGKIYGINEDNKHVVMNEFHQKFRCIELADEDLVNAIRHKLQIIQKQLRYPVPEYMYMTEKMEELSKSEKSIRNNHFKDILYSHRNEKCIQYFLNGKTVPFTEQFSNMNHRIFNIKPGGEPYLTFMKVLESLQEKNSWESFNNHILYLHPEDDFDTFTEMIGVFELDKYEILIMSLMNFTENEKINICSEITRLMSFDISKKVIVIADKVFFEDDLGVVEIDGQISFTDLTDSFKNELIETIVCFQGILIPLGEFEEYIPNLLESIDESTILKIIQKEEIVFGRENRCSNVIENFHISRTLKHNDQIFSEVDILEKLDVKIIVISDNAGMGKTTTLTFLEKVLKERYPFRWIMNPYLEDVMKKRDTEMNHRNILHSLIPKSPSDLEKCIFEHSEKIVMIDGIDEKQWNTRNDIIKFIFDIIKFVNVRIIMTTRAYEYIHKEMRRSFDYETVTLEPFSEEDQKIFLSKYNFNKKDVTTSVIEEFVKYLPYSLSDILGIPLYIRMISDILPDDMAMTKFLGAELNLYKLYKKYMNGKRGISNNDNSSPLNNSSEKFNDLQLLAMNIYVSEDIRYQLDLDAVTEIEYSFAHQTFAEYFIAEYLWKRLRERDVEGRFLVIMSDFFIRPEYENIARFMNDILAEKEGQGLLEHSMKKYNHLLWRGEKIFQILASKGLRNIIRLLFKDYINLEDDYGRTVIHYAAQNDSIEEMVYFVNHGADIALRDNTGSHALHVAAEHNAMKVIRYLIEQGVDLSIVNNCGDTVIHFAALGNALEAIQYFMSHGSDIATRDNDGDQPIHCAAYRNAILVIRFLIEQCGIDMDVVSNDGKTVTHFAAQSDSLDAIKYFMDHGADINRRTNDGNHAIHFAASSNAMKSIKYFIEEVGINLNIVNKNGKSLIHSAAENNDPMAMKYFVDHGADIARRTNEGYHAIHFAASSNAINSIRYLIDECGIDMDIVDDFGRTVIHCAAQSNSLDAIKYFMEHSTDINKRTNDGYHAIHLAAPANAIDSIKYLIDECGIDMNIVDDYGRTVIHSAAQMDCLEAIKYCVDHGADIDRQTNEGFHAIHLAASSNAMNSIKYFIEEAGININIVDKNGKSLIHSAAENDNPMAIKYFVDHGADIDRRTNDGYHAIHLAASANAIDSIKYLIDKSGIDINIVDDYGRTVIHLAAQMDCLEAIKYCVYHGADIDKQTNEGFHAIHLAASSNAMNSIKYFIEEVGINLNIVNKNGKSLIHSVMENNNPKAIKYFVDHGYHAIHLAAKGDSLEVVKYLIEQCGIDMYILDHQGHTCLDCAASRDSIKVAEYLVQCGFDLSTRDVDGDTVLHQTAYSGSLKIFKFLICCGMDLKTRNDEGATVLHVAASKHQMEAIKYFIEVGMDINITDYNGRKAIHYAAKEDLVEEISYFNDSGVDIYSTDKRGMTALHLAAIEDSVNAVKLFDRFGMYMSIRDNHGSTPLKYAVENLSFKTIEFYFSKMPSQ